jgi:MSHA biogenesis protein MshL
MVISGEIKMKNNFFCILCYALSFLLLPSCSSLRGTKAETIEPVIADQAIEKETKEQNMVPPATPEFVPVKDSSSPLQTKTVSVAARNTPLREVLFTVAETANLNLVMEQGVDAEIPVTMTIKNINIEDALNIIMDTADYFYSIKDNILTVSAMKTEIYELGHPNVIQAYSTKAGGDILSGTSSATGGTTNAISGDVSLQSESDKTSFSFWDAIEKSLDTLLKTQSAEQRRMQPSFTVNRMAGTIMVTAAKKDLDRVGAYIINLKNVLNRQVLIEARIVEVQLSKGLKYGIDWNSIADTFGNKISFGTEKFTSVIGNTSPSFQLSVIENNNFSFLLKALQEQGDVKTLSNPRISIMNGQTALLSVGRNTSFISKVETTTTAGTPPTTTFTVETNSVLSGIIFGIAPHINSNGEITLFITPIISNLVNLDEKTIGTGAGDSTVEIKLPTVDLREMNTTVKVLDGQMIIIGGLIDKREKSSEDKVPILGDIPILGAAFKSVDKSEDNTELVIMLIPRLVS